VIRTAIVAALPGELKPLVRSSGRGWRHEKRNRVHIWRWRAGELEWVAACAGVGQNAAARALAEIERDGPVAQILSVGWAGSLRKDREPGEAFRVIGVVDLPTNTRLRTSPFPPLRQEDGARMGQPGSSRAQLSQVPKGEGPFDGLRAGSGAPTAGSGTAQAVPFQSRSAEGTEETGTMSIHRDIWLATSTKVLTGEKEKTDVAISYYADLVDMEAIALARLARARGVAFHCIKGVSDGAEDILPDFNPFLGADGQFKQLKFIVFALFHPRYWQALKKMEENSKQAAQRIAELVLDLLDPEGTIRKTHGYPNISG
jgi:nucleoside phosphorylase